MSAVELSLLRIRQFIHDSNDDSYYTIAKCFQSISPNLNML